MRAQNETKGPKKETMKKHQKHYLAELLALSRRMPLENLDQKMGLYVEVERDSYFLKYW